MATEQILQDILDDVNRIYPLLEITEDSSIGAKNFRKRGEINQDIYIQGRLDERSKWVSEDPNFEAITGYKTLREQKIAEDVYDATQELMMKYIREWNGYTNSSFGEAMAEAVRRNSK